MRKRIAIKILCNRDRYSLYQIKEACKVEHIHISYWYNYELKHRPTFNYIKSK